MWQQTLLLYRAIRHTALYTQKAWKYTKMAVPSLFLMWASLVIKGLDQQRLKLMDVFLWTSAVIRATLSTVILPHEFSIV